MTKTTVLWFLGSAIVAMFNTTPVNAHYFRNLVFSNVALAAVLEFLVNRYTFSLPVELIFVPIVFLVVALRAVGGTKPEFAPAKKLFDVCSALIGFSLLIFSIREIVINRSDFFTVGSARDFLLPLVLTAFFVPYVYGLRVFSTLQTMFVMMRLGLRGDDRLYRFACRSILFACGPSIWRAQFFDSHFRYRLWGVTDRAAISQIVREFRAAWKQRRSMKQDDLPDNDAAFPAG